MMQHKVKSSICIFLISAAALCVTGCSASLPASQPSQVISTSQSHARHGEYSAEKYTKTDYDFMLSFKTKGYEKMAVEDFNRKVMDWDNEESYHKAEDIFKRVFGSISRNDENADFILGTLGDTWNECEKRHYNTCEKQQSPWHSGYAAYETYGDVFGDQVLLTGAYADFSFNYSIADGKSLSVGQREEILGGIRTGLEAYLKEQPVKALEKQKDMEKALSAQLKNLLTSLNSSITWSGDSDVSYDWEAPYNYEEDSQVTVIQENTAENAGSYTKEQYQMVLEKLKPEGYEAMSVSEFNRTINKALFGDDEDSEDLHYAYEMVMAFLSDEDENRAYLHDTVQRALDEYQTRCQEVYTGKTTDPEYSGNIHLSLEEDVFGDKVAVGDIEANYIFTYCISDADRLTVKDREQFINSVNQKAKKFMETAAEKDSVDKEDLKACLESAGKEAGNEFIQFTGCQVEYFEIYR